VLLSDKEMILKAQRGDANAFEELVRRHDKRVMSIALTHTRNEDDAKDVYQEVFLRVYKALPKFGFRSEFSTWMYRIVTNVCLTFHESRKKNQHVPFEENLLNGDGRLDSSTTNMQDGVSHNQLCSQLESTMLVQQSITELSPKQRMVLTLKHFHGYKIREIAVLMNCSEGTVKKHLFTAIERLRKRLKDS